MNGKITFRSLHDLAEFIAHMEYQKVQARFSVYKDQFSQAWILNFED
jgi:hypothetical protein